MADFTAHPLAPDAPAPGAPVRTYLGWSVVVSALCFLPLGLVAVLYAVGAARAATAGEEETARRRGRVARRWVIVTLVVGLLVDLGLVLVLLLLGAFSS